jgi:DegV family protein with EDD domain
VAIRIVTDSSADLPPDLADRWKITVVPCNVVIDDMNYKDGVDLAPEEFYRKLDSSSRSPTTAQPSVADFRSVYQALLDQGHEIVSIHVSGKLSGTLNSAERARDSLGESVPIEVIDSQLASLGMGLVVLRAARLAQETEPYRQLAKQVRSALPKTQCILVLDTLEYLQKGGRIGKAQAFLGSVLNVKPILKLRDGEVHPVERPRNLDRGVRRLAELARQYAPLRQLGVIYSTEPERATDLKHLLSDLIPEEEIVTSRFGATLGTYVGPRAVGVALTSTS